MYVIVRAKSFEQSLERLVRGGIKKSLQYEINQTIELLASGSKLPFNYRDHQLQGPLAEFRECHIQGDLLLKYKIENEALILVLFDIGSHSQLFG